MGNKVRHNELPSNHVLAHLEHAHVHIRGYDVQIAAVALADTAQVSPYETAMPAIPEQLTTQTAIDAMSNVVLNQGEVSLAA